MTEERAKKSVRTAEGSAIISALVIITLLLIPVIFLQATTIQKLRFGQGERGRIEANFQAQTKNNETLRLLPHIPNPRVSRVQVVTDQLSTLETKSEIGKTIKTDQYLISLSQSEIPRPHWGTFKEQLTQDRCRNWDVTSQLHKEISSQRTCRSLHRVSPPGTFIAGNLVIAEELVLSYQSPTPANIIIAVIGLVHLPNGLRIQSSAPLHLAIIAGGTIELEQLSSTQETSLTVYSSKEVVKIRTWPMSLPNCNLAPPKPQLFAYSPIRVELGEHSIQEPAVVGCVPEFFSPWWRTLKILGHTNSW